MLDIGRHNSEIHQRSIQYKSENACCKSSRTDYVSSDYGSNDSSSSSGDENPIRLYKFKSNMKHRFNVDLEHSRTSPATKKQRRTSGSSSSNYFHPYQTIDSKPTILKNYSNGDHNTSTYCSNDVRTSNVSQLKDFEFLNSSGPVSVNGVTQLSSNSALSLDEDNSLKSTVPIFAFNQSGSFYVPMSVDQSVVASAISKKPEMSPVLHPVSIYVNFTPACVPGRQSSMIGNTYPGHSAYKSAAYTELPCSANNIREDVKPVTRTELKKEIVVPPPVSSRSGASNSLSKSYFRELSNSQNKESHKRKMDQMEYSELNRPPIKGDHHQTNRCLAFKSGPEPNTDSVPRSIQHVPELRHHDVIPQLCKMRDVRELNGYHHHQLDLSHHSNSRTFYPSTVSNLPSKTTSGIHGHNLANLASCSTSSSGMSSLLSSSTLSLPHQQPSQNSTMILTRNSMRPVTNKDMHQDIPTTVPTVSECYDPAYTGGFHKAAMPWPYQLSTRQYLL